MRCMPTASAIVMATGRPSGTIDTIWLIATMSMSANGMPRSRPSSDDQDEQHQRGADQIAAELLRCAAPAASSAPRRLGQAGDLADFGGVPVATTTARPRPAVMWVPE